MDILCNCGREMSIGTFENNFFDMCDMIQCGTCNRVHRSVTLDQKVYMATPYSVGNACPTTRKARYNISCDMAAHLMDLGYFVFSPITHSHPISLCMNNSKDHEFWLDQDVLFMAFCDAMFIYSGISKWRNSFGINYEIGYMRKHEKPIRLFSDEDFEKQEIYLTFN